MADLSLGWLINPSSETDAPAPAPAAIPSPHAQIVLSPEQEQQFQLFMGLDPSVRAWRNSFSNRFGVAPNTESDPTYDYRAAWQAGHRPAPVTNDTVWHWGAPAGTVPELQTAKSPEHPTYWKQQFMDQFGLDVDKVQPQQWTPAMQTFMHKQIGQEIAKQLFGGSQ